jgi:hypothetical protein
MNKKKEKTFKPNIQWMAKKYEEMNQELFYGQLGDCDFGIFTTGKGSEGNILGWFKTKGGNIRIDRYSRRMFINGWERIYIDRNNFVELCQPTIELNGNYSGTEHGFLATLVHEMCHYYTFMDGYCPRQCHGFEFREIGSIVTSRSNGTFTIQRLASAEEMSELELSDEMKAKRERRLANKKAKVFALFNYKKDGQIQLTITSNDFLIMDIVASTKLRNDSIKIMKSNEQGLIEELFSYGYKKNMRTWRFWNIENKKWITPLMNHGFEMEEIYTDANPINHSSH